MMRIERRQLSIRTKGDPTSDRLLSRKYGTGTAERQEKGSAGMYVPGVCVREVTTIRRICSLCGGGQVSIYRC